MSAPLTFESVVEYFTYVRNKPAGGTIVMHPLDYQRLLELCKKEKDDNQ